MLFMKLLLTSSGITNTSIAAALLELTGKPFNECSLAFVPTASNVYRGNKDWVIKDLRVLQDLGFKSIDIVDMSALPKELWFPGFQTADVLLFEGGNTFHLMHWMEKSGLEELLREMLKTKVYVGISAGSIVTGKSLDMSMSEKLYSEEIGPYTSDRGLGLVDFLVRAHVRSSHFPRMTFDALDEIAKEQTETFYAIDDQSAIKVVDGVVTVVSEGSWKKYH